MQGQAIIAHHCGDMGHAASVSNSPGLATRRRGLQCCRWLSDEDDRVTQPDLPVQYHRFFGEQVFESAAVYGP